MIWIPQTLEELAADPPENVTGFGVTKEVYVALARRVIALEAASREPRDQASTG